VQEPCAEQPLHPGAAPAGTDPPRQVAAGRCAARTRPQCVRESARVFAKFFRSGCACLSASSPSRVTWARARHGELALHDLFAPWPVRGQLLDEMVRSMMGGVRRSIGTTAGAIGLPCVAGYLYIVFTRTRETYDWSLTRRQGDVLRRSPRELVPIYVRQPSPGAAIHKCIIHVPRIAGHHAIHMNYNPGQPNQPRRFRASCYRRIRIDSCFTIRAVKNHQMLLCFRYIYDPNRTSFRSDLVRFDCQPVYVALCTQCNDTN
jgi:hypothetical protein